MPDKFGRKFKITMYPPASVGNVLSPVASAFSKTVVEIYDPFTFEFSIRRAIQSSSNIGTFRIYNLSEETRSVIFKDFFDPARARRIVVQAGYATPLPTVFDGNMKWSFSYRPEGSVNFISEIEAWDFGSFAQTNADSNFTLDGANRLQIVERLISDMSAWGTTKGAIGSLPEYQSLGKRTVCGPSWKALLDETQNRCFIDNGRINILADHQCFNGDVTSISSQTGLLGSPRRSESYVQAETIFEPGLKLGQIVDLTTESQKVFNGRYKVVGLTHNGVISGSISGKCKTTVSLYSFEKNVEIVNG